jgi:hypothetical protein
METQEKKEILLASFFAGICIGFLSNSFAFGVIGGLIFLNSCCLMHLTK